MIAVANVFPQGRFHEELQLFVKIIGHEVKIQEFTIRQIHQGGEGKEGVIEQIENAVPAAGACRLSA